MNNFVFICLMVLIVFICYYENRQLRKDIDENKCTLYKLEIRISELEEFIKLNDSYCNELDEKHKLINDKCDKTLKEFNEIMFGNPPLKNKVVVVRSIKDYDYTAYRKDIESLNEYLKEGWSIVSHETSDFVHTYVLGMPLVWQDEKEDDKGCDDDVE